MKKPFLLLFLMCALSSSFLFTSCGDDGDDSDSGLAVGELTMKIDGTEVTTSSVLVSNVNFTYPSLVIQATSGSDRVTLTTNDITTGSYAIDLDHLYDAGNYGSATYSPNHTDITNQYGSISGTINLSEVTPSTVSGSFNFTASKAGVNVAITSGEFNKLPR